jgi:hypothetical protein
MNQGRADDLRARVWCRVDKPRSNASGAPQGIEAQMGDTQEGSASGSAMGSAVSGAGAPMST